MIWRAVAVDPVKAILSTSGWSTSALPASLPYPLTILITPGGNPAFSISDAKYRIEMGVCSAGLSTTVLPQASAGPSFQPAIMRGKFQGIIWPTTPMGCLMVYANFCGVVGIVRPWILSAQPA